jgi:hypothetical protein
VKYLADLVSSRLEGEDMDAGNSSEEDIGMEPGPSRRRDARSRNEVRPREDREDSEAATLGASTDSRSLPSTSVSSERSTLAPTRRPTRRSSRPATATVTAATDSLMRGSTHDVSSASTPEVTELFEPSRSMPVVVPSGDEPPSYDALRQPPYNVFEGESSGSGGARPRTAVSPTRRVTFPERYDERFGNKRRKKGERLNRVSSSLTAGSATMASTTPSAPASLPASDYAVATLPSSPPPPRNALSEDLFGSDSGNDSDSDMTAVLAAARAIDEAQSGVRSSATTEVSEETAETTPRSPSLRSSRLSREHIDID